MNKKQYVLKVLSAMEDSRAIAWWLKYFVEENKFDDKSLDILVKMLQTSLKTATSAIGKDKLEKANKVLLKLKQKEKNQNTLDQKDIAELDKMTAGF